MFSFLRNLFIKISSMITIISCRVIAYPEQKTSVRIRHLNLPEKFMTSTMSPRDPPSDVALQL